MPLLWVALPILLWNETLLVQSGPEPVGLQWGWEYVVEVCDDNQRLRVEILFQVDPDKPKEFFRTVCPQ